MPNDDLQILHEQPALSRRSIQRKDDMAGCLRKLRRWFGGGDDVLEIWMAVRLILHPRRQFKRLGVWHRRHVSDLGTVVNEEGGMIATANDAAEERSQIE